MQTRLLKKLPAQGLFAMVTASGLAWTDTLSAFPDTACKDKNLVQERK